MTSINRNSHWKQKNGEMIAIKDMSSPHPRNCVAMLKRQVEKRNDEEVEAFGAAANINGDMASYHVDQELMRLSDQNAEFILQANQYIKAMFEEVARREQADQTASKGKGPCAQAWRVAGEPSTYEAFRKGWEAGHAHAKGNRPAEHPRPWVPDEAMGL